MTIGDSPQPAIPNTPAGGPTPEVYVGAEDAILWLATRWGLSASITTGHMLAASMALDEEAPFRGVKVNPAQERQWPRTYKYGWPNIIAAPTPVLVDIQFAGVFYLNYEGVVPQQVVDWVCLKGYQFATLPFDRPIQSESVTGASVHYAPPLGLPGGQQSQLEVIMDSLLLPFLERQAHRSPFPNYTAV